MKTKSKKLNRIVKIALLSAIAFMLQTLGSAMGLKVGGFLEIEISDLPALVGAFALGPLAGFTIELIKNALHCFITSTGFVGELANLAVNGIFVSVAGIIYKHKKTKKTALVSMLAATLAMSAAGILTNLFIMLPLYMPDAEFSVRLGIVLSTITPFNLVKGAVLSVITFLSYKKLKPLLI